MVNSDPNLLAEIIQNFVSNAIRYTDKGSVRLECRGNGRSLRDPGHRYRYRHRRQISCEEIFREFHQCKAPGASKEGFGLGLAIVKRLSDLLDLTIDVALR